MLNKNTKKHGFVLFLFVLTGLIAVINLFSVEVKKVDIRKYEEFQEGEFEGTSLDSKGRLFIGPEVKTIPGPAAEYYLSLDMSASGDIYVGTGHKAIVYKIKPAPAFPTPQQGNAADSASNTNNVEEIFTSPEAIDVFALLVKSNGEIFIGSSPEGKIYKISPNAKTKEYKEFFNPEDKFIWDLKEDKDGNILCAVGNDGGIFRITPDGTGVKIFESEDTHIVSLYVTSGNSILAGSGDRGALYRIDNRKVKVLYSTPFEEIKGICEDKNGNIYFSATRGASRQDTLKTSQDKTAAAKIKELKEEKIAEKSALYCLHTDGVAEMLWKSESEYIYTLVYDEKNDSVLFGTGDSGRVYRIKKDRAYSIVYESQSAQVFKIIAKGKGFTMITNNTPTLARLEDSFSSKGNYISDVYDLKIQSRVGRLYWDAETTPQCGVSLFVRTGNTKNIDSTWSQWSAPYTDPENSSINIPDCRYIQVKALLNSRNALDTPYLSGIKIYYVQANLGPRVKSINIEKASAKTVLPVEVDKTKPAPLPAKNTRSLTITWTAEDPNNDKLNYTVSMKKTTAANWIPVKENLTEPKLELEMELFQDGNYILKVEADDALSNPPGAVKSSFLLSSPFIIDSTPPVISSFSAVGPKVKFNVQDQTSIISEVLYSFEGKIWYPVFPVDGINDSRAESYEADLKSPGTRKVFFIKARDEYGNSSVFQAEL